MCHKQIAGKAKQQIATDDMGQTVAALKEIVCILNILCFCIVKLLFSIDPIFLKLLVQRSNRKNLFPIKNISPSHIKMKFNTLNQIISAFFCVHVNANRVRLEMLRAASLFARCSIAGHLNYDQYLC